VDGESTQADHKGEIQIESFSFGASQASSTRLPNGGGAIGRPVIEDFHVVQTVSKATPALLEAAISGRHYAKVVFSAQRAGERTPQDYFKITLSDVLVSSYQTTGSTDTEPLEELSLNFTKIEFAVLPPGGSVGDPTTGGPVQSSWSNAQNRGNSTPAIKLIDRTEAPAAQFALFIKFDGVDGESKDADHKGEIEIESFSWGVSNPTSARAAGGGGGAGKASFSDLSFTTTISKASPLLFRAAASGKHFTDAVLTSTRRTPNGPPQHYYVIKMADVLVSSYQSSGNTGSGVVDDVGLKFSKLAFAMASSPPLSAGQLARDRWFTALGLD